MWIINVFYGNYVINILLLPVNPKTHFDGSFTWFFLGPTPECWAILFLM